MPARRSCFQVIRPVSTLMACTVPTLSVPGVMCFWTRMSYGDRGERLVAHRRDRAARVLQREIHGMGQRAVRAGREILAAVGGRAHETLIADFVEYGLGIYRDVAGCAIDLGHHVLTHRWSGPQKFARFAVQCVYDSGFAWNTRHHFANARQA